MAYTCVYTVDGPGMSLLCYNHVQNVEWLLQVSVYNICCAWLGSILFAAIG